MTTPHWLTEFDEKFLADNWIDTVAVDKRASEVKAFITQLLLDEREGWRSEMRERIEEIKNKRPNIPFPDDGFFSNNIKEFDKAIGYHKAVEDMIEILKKIL